MKIVHAADLHLDSPLRGLGRLGDDDVATLLRQASRRALENLVRLVVDSGARALVLAGDTYDGDWRDYATGRFFAEQMDVLHAHGIPVVMVAGNHDAQSQITRSLRLPPSVRVLSTAAPETVVLDDLGLAVHGQGFARRDVTENLVLDYPQRLPGVVNVGLLHTAVNGAEGHDRYAPCSRDDLAAPRYEYMALGHIHQRGVVNDGLHVAAYSGNVQGRHPGERGAKGALVVDLEAGAPAQLRFEALDVARWEALTVDASAARSVDDVLATLDTTLGEARAGAGGRQLVARVTVIGATPAAGALADPDQLTEEAALLGRRHGITLEKVRSRALPPELGSAGDPELTTAIEAASRALAQDASTLRDLARPLDREIGRLLREHGGPDLRDGEYLAALAAQAAGGLQALLGATRPETAS